MKTLGIWRHAKSDWNDRSARDFDRPLNARGLKGAAIMGKHIAGQPIYWERIVASPAVRVAQTIELGSQAARINPQVRWDRRIYLASSATLIDLLREQDGDPTTILMVGHNPGLEDLIFDLVPDDGSSPLRDIVEEKFPTAAFAKLEIDIASWADLEEASARLVLLTRPRDLDAELGPEPVS
ncbi:histidine phosphatase family protein [Novosphingobium sp. G106]|uniref:SixA phosphatase family protein n=1 Tax=Novosphingobium sp. G106 TaxID=2849500 RepID=UPI001C2CCD59|nr:histidine phosphatase family protein [Novosphingobium sp. G106]MBV1687989.1 histidine phosphatase family protein [Novosphingobium sp. G106]